MFYTTRSIWLRSLVTTLIVVTTCGRGIAEQPAAATPAAAVADIVYIDRGEFLPAGLRHVTTGEDRVLSLNEITELVRRETGLHVVLDERNLKDLDVTGDAALSWLGGVPLDVALDYACDSLSNAPLSWYLEHNVLFVTTHDLRDEHRIADAFDITRHLQLGMTAEEVMDAVQVATFGRNWHAIDGVAVGELQVVGNVLHVQTSPMNLCRTAGVLRALVTPGGVRHFDQAPAGAHVRKLLGAPSDIELPTVALNELPSRLARQLGIRVLLDESALRDEDVDLFEPMPVQGLGRPLWKVLSDDRLGLVPSVTHGFLEITTARSIENEPFGAVYDVSGILPGLTSVRAFNEAIEEVAWTGAAWAESATTMTIHRAGLLVAWCNETRHRELQQLLAAQRDQMRADVLSAEDLAVVETRYYRLKTETAADLLRLIPELIAPDTWRSEARPEAVGIIRQVALGPLYGPQEKLMQGGGFFQVPAATESATETTTRPSREKYTALVVRQTRRVQITIQRMLDALLNGNPGDDWDDVTVPTGEVPLD